MSDNTDETTPLSRVHFVAGVLGPTRRTQNDLNSAQVDALYLQGDMVVWEKGNEVRYVPLSNVKLLEVAD